MKGLILAGGKGSRLRPLTHTGAKQTIPVANKPILCYIIEDLVASGIKEIGIVVGYTPERIQQVKDAVGDAKRYGDGVKIHYIEQDAPRGIAHAVLVAEGFLKGDKFVVYLGDNMLENGISHFVKEFEKSDCDAGLLVTAVSNPEVYGVADVNEKHEITDIEEKPKCPKTNYAVIGVYMYKPFVFDIIRKLKPSNRGEIEITDLNREILRSGKRVSSHFVEGWWDDTGTPEAILMVNRRILDDKVVGYNRAEVEKSVSIQGKARIEAGTTISGKTTIRGPVCIGKGCRISGNTYIGPHTSIGDNCVLNNANIESSVVLEGTVIESPQKIIESLIGKNCTISSADSGVPKGHRIVIGENSSISL